MTGKRILVTGATGFTGGHLCRRLAESGHAVRALIRNPVRSSALRRYGVEPSVGDLRDPESLRQAMTGIEVVYHIAAIYRQANVTRKEMWETNVQGTKNLLDAAVRADVRRFIHCSTIGVHGGIKNPPANEQTPYGPGDDYQESKVEGERLALEYMKEDRIPVVVFRPTGIYGPHDLRFLKLFKAIKTRRFVMLGSGQIMYHFVYIDDLIGGILLCGSKDEAVGNVYILGGSESVTLNQLVRLIGEELGVRPPTWRLPIAPFYLAGFLCELICKPFRINPPLYRRRVDFFRKNRSFDISKAKKELGFRPGTDLKTGISLTAQWYRNEGLL